MMFWIAGCSQDELPPLEYTLSLELSGHCTDLTAPSLFKEIDTYEVEGFFGVTECDESCNSYGFIFVTDEERSKRDELGLQTLEMSDFYNLPVYERYKHYQITDTPYVKIYSISEEIFSKDKWQLDAYHSYIGDDDQDYHLYGINEAECSLNVTERQGIITEDIKNKVDWCFDLDCWEDNFNKSRFPSNSKTFESYMEKNL